MNGIFVNGARIGLGEDRPVNVDAKRRLANVEFVSFMQFHSLKWSTFFEGKGEEGSELNTIERAGIFGGFPTFPQIGFFAVRIGFWGTINYMERESGSTHV